MTTRYLSGVVSGENTLMFHSEHESFDGTSPLVLACHNATGTELFSDATRQSVNGVNYYMRKLAQAGFIVLSLYHSGDPYGAAGGTVDLAEAVTWGRANGAKSGPVGLFAWSAGATVAVRYWSDEPDDVGAAVFAMPLVNIDNAYDDNASLQAAIDAAWGGDYATNGADFSPHVLAPDLETIEGAVWAATDDTIIRVVDAATFAAAVGFRYFDMTGGHTALTAKTAPLKQLISVMETLRG